MKTKKLLTVLLAMMLFTGCGSDAVVTSYTEPVEISLSWWGNDVRHEYTIAAVKEFEKLHPDIEVNCHYSEWSGYQQRSNAQMASDTEADVMQINYAWIQQYSPDGMGFYDINKVSDYIDLSNFTQEELNFGMQHGSLNAIPIALNTQTVYINKTVYADYGLDVPKTWDDIFEAAKVMNGEVYPLSMVAKSVWFCSVAYAEQQIGKQFMTIEGDINFSAEDIQLMLDFYCRLIHEKVIPQPEYFDQLNMNSGQYAGTVAWISDASSHCSKAIENGYEIVVADYLSDTAEKLEGWYEKPATMYAISKNTSYPEQSAMLLDFLLNSEEMAVLQGVEKGVPVSESARTALAKNDMLTGIQYEAFQKMNDRTKEISLVSPYLENDDLITEFCNAGNAVLYDKISAEEQAKELQKRFQSILAQAKEY